MFFSYNLLDRRHPAGQIWLAAHKKLKSRQEFLQAINSLDDGISARPHQPQSPTRSLQALPLYSTGKCTETFLLRRERAGDETWRSGGDSERGRAELAPQRFGADVRLRPRVRKEARLP